MAKSKLRFYFNIVAVIVFISYLALIIFTDLLFILLDICQLLNKKEVIKMATTKLGNTKQTSRVINYAEKHSGLNCDIDYAKSVFKQTRALYGKENGGSHIQ